jgi:pimeloyl-ACP methyl ester carboxylesterase
VQNSNKSALVFLPGMLCDETLWSHQIANFADMTEIRTMDLTRAASVREMAWATLAASPQHFAMAGLSLGGIVAFEIMRLAPERITRLGLLDTTPYLMQPERAQPWKPLLEIADEQDFTALASYQLASMLHPKHRDDPRLLEAVQKLVNHIGQTGLKNQWSAQLQ